MQISLTADTKGIRPQDLKTPTLYTIQAMDGETNPVTESERANKKDGGVFKQYALHLLDTQGDEQVLRYLMESDLSPIAREYGPDPTQWNSKLVIVSCVTVNRDGKTFYNAKLETP